MSVSLHINHLNHYSALYAVNRLPLVDSVSVETDEPLEGVELLVEFSPELLRPLRWNLENLEPAIHVREGVCSSYDPESLNRIIEAAPGMGRAKLLRGEEVLVEKEFSFTWLPSNAWAGCARYPELLASLVLPNDPAIDVLLSRGADILQANGLASSWRGYQAEKNAIINQVHALWNALEDQHINYTLPPRSWHEHGSGQKVRTPSQIMQGGCATCLDSTVCLAAAMAQAGFNPLIVLLPGHAFVGVMLKDASLVTPIEKHAGTLRNLLELEEVLLLETTLATCNDPTPARLGFDAARSAAERLLRIQEEQDEFMALDIVRIWATGIHPFMAPVTEGGTPSCTRPDTPHWRKPRTDGGEGTPGFLPETSAEEREAAVSLVSARNRTRMEKWQLKLLDLSLRNNLLNSRIDRSQVSLLLPNVAQLEDALANGRTFTIRNVPETFGTQMTQAAATSRPETLRSELLPLADEMFGKGQLLAIDVAAEMDEKMLEKRVKALHDKARKHMEESGCNTLNLACGFLKWTPKEHRARTLYAPLLLIPVTLKRPSVRAGFRLCSSGEEPCINHTLLELLKTEYGMRITELEGELPHDAEGVDVARILQTVRDAIREYPGWEVLDLCTLGIFSFAKYLMWLDLKERQESLMVNPIVRHLAESTPTTFHAQVDFPSPESLDAEVDASRIFTPLSADSSQLAAVLAAARGKNFVLIGPPGTGKSQTIANMIAHSLGQGKTVLFVAEKSAALSVVYKRLCRIGLGAFCLELHSNKANKKEVIAQFAQVLEQSALPVGRTSWQAVVNRLLRLRTELNALPQELHRSYPDGGSLYEDIGYLADAGESPLFSPSAVDPAELTAEQHDALLSEASKLARRFSLVADVYPGVAEALQAVSYSTTWDQELADALAHYSSLVETWRRDYLALAGLLGLDGEACMPHVAELEAILGVAEQTLGQDVLPLLPARAGASLERAARELALAGEYHKARAALSLEYPDTALEEPMLDQWMKEWKMAQISNFISRFFTTRRICRQLRFLAFSRKQPHAQSDLTNLIAMRALRDELRASLRADNSLPQYRRGLDMTEEHLKEARSIADKLRGVQHLSEQAEAWLSGQSPMAHGSPAIALLATLSADMQAIRAHEPLLERLLESSVAPFRHEVKTTLAWSSALRELRPRWRDILLWNRQVRESRAENYAALTEALQSHVVAPEQLESATEWNLRLQRTVRSIDESTTLSLFDRDVQEGTISDFVAQDARLLSTSASQLLAGLTERAAGIHNPDYRTELALLQREIAKQKRHIAPRRLLYETSHVARLLKPCMLMSPLSVAQYLRPDSDAFDIVIFDEASQIPVWDAIGAIGRGQSAVIVGDPKQMPPTSFFAKGNTEEPEEEEDGVPEDMESILDECLACDIPKMALEWHYRSKAESLIAFSNHNYYEGKLTTFPAPVTQDNALQYHYVKGTYHKGSRRTNPAEARALVDHIIATLKAPGFRYTEATSIGVVTFNTSQQALIEDMLEEKRAEDESLEPFFAEGNPEAIFVKNLENVQGDERGCIYFSTTFGPDEVGAVSMNFGPINNLGGERRLNVAITRARAAMHVFSSLKPEDINLSRTKAKGAADLRHFLECASLGVSSYFCLLGSGEVQKPHHQFASVIARRLGELGWNCRVNVGVSDFRIDVAVAQPDVEGTMLAGIMLDGPSYASAHTARDRDVLRTSVLEGLGWRLVHLWALDWWRNPQACLERLDAHLRNLCKQGPPVMPELPSLLEEA